MKKAAIEHEQICWDALELQPREPTFRAIPLGINYAEKIFYHLLECSTAYPRARTAVGIVVPSWRRRHGGPKRRGPPKPTRLRPSPPWPACARPLTTWASHRACGAPSRGGGWRPPGPRRRHRYRPPTTCRSAAVEARHPSVSKRGSLWGRATPGALRPAAVSWGRG